MDAAVIRIRTFLALRDARRLTWANLERPAAKRVLVICYGNIYRSPFVGALLSQRLGPTVEVRSGGFHPVAGRPSPEKHIAACTRYGVALDRHRSTVVSVADVAWADLIVLMDRYNWAMLTRLGAKPEQLVWLGALVSGDVEIADPYEAGEEEADGVRARLSAASEALIGALERVR